MIGELLVTALVAVGGPESTAHFDPPVRLMAGEKHMGEKRLYPSPVMHDIDGDGVSEMVIGDLIGKLTVSRLEGNAWTEPKPLQGAEGKPLKFHNW